MRKLFQKKKEKRDGIRQKMLRDIEEGNTREEYRKSKDEYKGKYRECITKVEEINLEKGNLESLLFKQTSPYFPIISSGLITFIITMVQFLNIYIKGENGSQLSNVIAYLISVVFLCIFTYKIYEVLFNSDDRMQEYYIRLIALQELEKEILENNKSESYEVLKEAVVKKTEDNNKINRGRRIKDKLK
jgi:hypothetical protein